MTMNNLLVCFVMLTMTTRAKQSWTLTLNAYFKSEQARALAVKHKLQFIGEILPESGLYEVGCDDDDDKCNAHFIDILEEDAVENAELQSTRKIELQGFTANLIDPWWNETWHLNPNADLMPGANTYKTGGMNVHKAWEMGIIGKGVNVVNVDNGIQHTHDDLYLNYDPSLSTDLIDNDDNPYNNTKESHHGTCMAGLIAARGNNSKCTSGVAFGVRNGLIRVLDGKTTETNDGREARAFSFARSKVDIYVIGFGPSEVNFAPMGKLVKKALEEGATIGRSGKGSIFLQPGGNSGLNSGGSCSHDVLVNSIYTIGINAVGRAGTKPKYGELCPGIMAAAYSSGIYPDPYMVTTDVGNSCTKTFSGTSSSVAVAGGVMALTLEANPSLTWRDVQHLIVQSTRRDVVNSGHAQWIINAAGHRYSTAFGFGLMDAEQLVMNAKNWTQVGPQITWHARLHRDNDDDDQVLTVYPNGLKSQVIDVPDDCPIGKLEHILIILTISAYRRGDVSVRLTSPQGTNVTLITGSRFDISWDGFKNQSILSLVTWDEDPRGQWTLDLVHKGTRGGTYRRPITLDGAHFELFGTKGQQLQVKGAKKPRRLLLKTPTNEKNAMNVQDPAVGSNSPPSRNALTLLGIATLWLLFGKAI